ncbi:MAG: ParB/RepB/Spo0J family partition protein [Rhodothermaceae bacterium]|nr:ParB/RepB/Spo0J family partition protein [Rhodothermaceae bacterium]MYC04946.1 ParB/RepB/Spo0J family partition protein [Rhodothermaceae bacterium]MYI16641.1 ParB/RepB/Spo0J family partition protein [Rhodothermaceae bacterium]
MTNPKSVLGRGLDAILSNDGQLRSEEHAHSLVGGIFELPVGSIKPNPFQPRQEFNEEALESLSQSIAQLGIIQPITVRATRGDEFELISGERRLRAAKLAGLEEIPAYIRPAKDVRMLEMALVENVQREELNPIEVALGYRRLIEEYGLTQEEVAQRVGKQRSTIANFLRLLHLPPRVQIGLREGVVTPGHARALLSLRDDRAINRLFGETRRKNLSVRDVEQRVKLLLRQPDTSKKHTPPSSMYLAQFENKLRKHLGTKVQIIDKAKGSGRIEIHYYSEEDLSRIVELLEGAG